jgi:DNA-binding transcriptional ArsR family regulator
MARPFNSPDVFRAVAHPVRRRILELVRQKDLTTSEIAQPFRLSQTTISEHLRSLRSAGLVEDHDRGRYRLYRLAPERLREVDRWIAEFKSILARVSR